MKRILLWAALIFAAASTTEASMVSKKGLASWYGEAHRGKLMANGKKFNPDRLTAASWFYPLGTKVRVTAKAPDNSARSVLVTITDRGPAHDLVREGRIIDLAHAAYKRLGHPDLGLVSVMVQPANHP
jgi:rare lipoprotein A